MEKRLSTRKRDQPLANLHYEFLSVAQPIRRAEIFSHRSLQEYRGGV